MRYGKLKPLAFLIVCFCSFGAQAKTIDIRDCSLEGLTFVDPWAGGSFTVRKVGTAYAYNCPEGVVVPNDECRGPYGDLVLEGDYRENSNDGPVTKSAIWSVIPAVPCCGWNVLQGAYLPSEKGFAWLTGSAVPKLADMSFLSIESESGEDFGNPLMAASCEIR